MGSIKLKSSKNGTSTKLIVFLHGYRKKPHSIHSIVDHIWNEQPDADVYSPTLPYSAATSVVRLTEVARQSVIEIDGIWQQKINVSGAPYSEVIFMGHSTGAVLARRLVICAYGEVESEDGAGNHIIKAPFEEGLNKKKRPWADSITRLVLLASMTRGWSIDSVKSRIEALKWSVGSFMAHALYLEPTIFDIRRGAAFLVQTRLQWLALMRAPEGRRPANLIVVQLLGTVDNLVAPDDNLDFSIDRGKQFFFIQVPFTSHTSIIDVGSGTRSSESNEGRRADIIANALNYNADELQAIADPIETMGDILPVEPDESVKHVAFVVHGIRDLGYWTQKIATKIRKQSSGEFKSLTPSYGYFNMLPFAWWWIRRRKVEWFMDHYVEARSNYPNAEIDYVGHSNGTYLLARALKDYPACRVRNIVFAGSVVRSDYDWQEKLERGQVQKVLNYVATSDWVVASFPSAVRWIRQFDLGGAGINGFDTGCKEVANVEYVIGGHGAAVRESHWDDIARYIVEGDTTPLSAHRDKTEYSNQRALWVKVLDLASPGLLIGVLLLLLMVVGCAVLPLLASILAVMVSNPWQTAGLLLIAGVYLLLSRL